MFSASSRSFISAESTIIPRKILSLHEKTVTPIPERSNDQRDVHHEKIQCGVTCSASVWDEKNHLLQHVFFAHINVRRSWKIADDECRLDASHHWLKYDFRQ